MSFCLGSLRTIVLVVAATYLFDVLDGVDGISQEVTLEESSTNNLNFKLIKIDPKEQKHPRVFYEKIFGNNEPHDDEVLSIVPWCNPALDVSYCTESTNNDASTRFLPSQVTFVPERTDEMFTGVYFGTTSTDYQTEMGSLSLATMSAMMILESRDTIPGRSRKHFPRIEMKSEKIESLMFSVRGYTHSASIALELLNMYGSALTGTNAQECFSLGSLGNDPAEHRIASRIREKDLGISREAASTNANLRQWNTVGCSDLLPSSDEVTYGTNKREGYDIKLRRGSGKCTLTSVATEFPESTFDILFFSISIHGSSFFQTVHLELTVYTGVGSSAKRMVTSMHTLYKALRLDQTHSSAGGYYATVSFPFSISRTATWVRAQLVLERDTSEISLLDPLFVLSKLGKQVQRKRSRVYTSPKPGRSDASKTQPDMNVSTTRSTVTVIGIILAIVVVVLVAFCCVWKYCRNARSQQRSSNVLHSPFVEHPMTERPTYLEQAVPMQHGYAPSPQQHHQQFYPHHGYAPPQQHQLYPPLQSS